MVSVDELESHRAAYALLIDGISKIFVTDDDLAESSGGDWHLFQGFASTHVGLQVPNDLPMGVNIRTGNLTSQSVTFNIDDVDGTLNTLFSSKFSDADILEFSLKPSETAPANLFNKHVGIESIGGNGQRRQRSCVQGFNIGMNHPGVDENAALYQGQVPVSDEPVLFAGRRVCVYRVFQNVDGTWNNIGSSTTQRIWWGTLRDVGRVTGSRWSLKCEGPESWLSKSLGRNTFNSDQLGEEGFVPINIRAQPSLEDDERLLGGTMYLERNVPLQISLGAIELADTQLSSSNTFSEIALGFNNFLKDLREDDGPFGDSFDGDDQIDIVENPKLFLDQQNRIVFNFNTVFGKDPIPNALARIDAHEKVWLAMGFDPKNQTDIEALSPFGKGLAISDPKWVRFFSLDDNPGYFEAHITTWPREKFEQIANGEGVDIWFGDDGETYEPLYEDEVTIINADGTQEIELVSYDRLYIQGQLDRPPMEDPDDPGTAFSFSVLGSGDVDSQRLFVLFGKRRIEGPGEEVQDEIQVIRASWIDAGGFIGDGDRALPIMVIEAFLNPRWFGIDRDQITGNWAALTDGENAISIAPLTTFQHYNGPDHVSAVIQRILLTTGTSRGWFTDQTFTVPGFGTQANNRIDEGDNNSQGPIRKDAEIADMGLAIPNSMVDSALQFDFEYKRLEKYEEFGRVKLAIIGQRNSKDILEGLKAPYGWAWSLRDGKYGIFSPYDMVGPGEADIALSLEDYVGDPANPGGSIPKQDLRIFAPIDSINLDFRFNPFTNDFLRNTSQKSTDPGAQYRAGNIVHNIEAPGLIDSKKNQGLPGAKWPTGFRERWFRILTWWSQRHFVIKGLRINNRKGKDIWPGSRVRITDEWIIDPTTGNEGIVNMTGYCIAKSENPKTEVVTVDLLIHEGSGGASSFYAPSARAKQDGYDPNLLGMGFRILVEDDYLQFRDGNSLDISAFVEPSFSTLGGDANIEIFQWDGDEWAGGIFGQVASVNAEAGDSYIILQGALTGAPFFRDMDHIVVMREPDNQSATWVNALLAPITKPDGTLSPGNVGDKWNQ